MDNIHTVYLFKIWNPNSQKTLHPSWVFYKIDMLLLSMPSIFFTCLRSMLKVYYQLFLKCDSWTSSINITKELIRNANFGVPAPDPLDRKLGGWGPGIADLLLNTSTSSLLVLCVIHTTWKLVRKLDSGPTPGPIGSESAFRQDPQEIFTYRKLRD